MQATNGLVALLYIKDPDVSCLFCCLQYVYCFLGHYPCECHFCLIFFLLLGHCTLHIFCAMTNMSVMFFTMFCIFLHLVTSV